MSVLTTKRNVILLALFATILGLIASGRDWVTGSLNDGVSQVNEVTATGNQAVPGFFGIALVAGAAVIAAATSGRIVRWIAALVAVGASVAMVALCAMTLGNPDDALKSRMAEVTGHTGEALARGTLTIWFWVATFASVLAVVTSLLAVLGVRRWPGLSSRYDAPADSEAKVRSDWDLMNAGIDPTETEAEGSSRVSRDAS